MNIKWDNLVTADALLAETKQATKRQLVEWISEITLQITGPVPLDEKISWSAKEAEARAMIEGAAPGQMILDECAMTGEEAGALALRIVRKADAYRAAIAMLTGLRRDVEGQIDRAVTPDEARSVLTRAQVAWLSAT